MPVQSKSPSDKRLVATDSTNQPTAALFRDIQSVKEAPSQSVAAINTVHHHHKIPRSQPNKQAKLSEAMGISQNVRQVNASCWKQWLRAFFFWLQGGVQSVMLVLVSSSANEQLQAHPGSTVCPRLDYDSAGVALPTLLCQRPVCLGQHENSDPKLCGSLEDCFGP